MREASEDTRHARPDGDRGRPRGVARVSHAMALALSVWSVFLWTVGGFDQVVAGVRLRANDPRRALLLASLAWATFVLTGGRTPRWMTAIGRAAQRLPRAGAEPVLRAAAAILRAGGRVLRASDARIRRACPADGRAASAVRAAARWTASLATQRPGLIVPLAVVVAFLPSLPATVAPAHDALQVFTAYWTYVSGLIADARLPEWIPFSRYGTPSAPILMYVTPFAYASGAIGAVLHAAFGFHDLLLLFKLTILIEYLVFAGGLLRVSRMILRSAWLPYGVAVAGVLSAPWILSLDGNFHAFYLTPWILASLVRAFETGEPLHLGVAAIVAVCSCVGNVPYYPPFLLLQLTVFAAAYASAAPRQIARLAARPAAWLWLVVAGAAFAVHLVALVKGMDGLAILTPGRDPITNHVYKDTFLTYAGVTKPLRLAIEWLTGRTINGDNTFYMGLAPLVLLPLGALVPKPPAVRALMVLLLFLLLFSTGGLVASASYAFPGMVFYRHVSIVFGVVRGLGLLCSAWVADRALHGGLTLPVSPRRAWSPVLAAVVVALAVGEFVRAQVSGPDLALALVRADVSVWYLGGCVALYGVLLLVARPLLPRRAVPYLITAALVFDVSGFWARGWIEWPRLTGDQAATLADLSKPGVLTDPGPRVTSAEAGQNAAFRFVMGTPPLNLGAMYVHTYFWAGVDPCVPMLRTDFIASSIAGLFARRGVKFDASENTERRVSADPWLASALACGEPRVRSDARVASTDWGDDWIQMQVDNPRDVPVPLRVSEAFAPGWGLTLDGRPSEFVVRDDAFLGASVPPGAHRLEFRFHDAIAAPLRTLEAVLSGLGAFWLVGLSIRHNVRPHDLGPGRRR